MNFFSGHSLLYSDGSEKPVAEALRDKKVLALYFSAHWCPPCRQFTPLLKRAFEEARPARSAVVFVSSDRSAQEQLSYMREAHGAWPAVRAGSDLAQYLGSALGVRGIPALIVVNATDGAVITKDGREDVLRHGAAAFALWEDQVASEVDTSAVELLKDNPPDVRREAVEILLKLLNNVRKDPSNIKFRAIKLSNPKIESKLLSANGAFEILFSVGFEESDDSLILPLSAPMTTLVAFCEAIQPLLGSTNDAGSSKASFAPKPSSVPCQTADSQQQSSSTGATDSPSQPSPKSDFFDKLKNEQEFFRKLEGELEHVLKYEDPDAQDQARKAVPVETLEKLAREKFEKIKQEDPGVKTSMERDLLLLELLRWFKADFFKWMDQPLCEDGVTKAVYQGSVVPTEQERADGANSVEGYMCPNTNKSIRFPRYHSQPAKLLSTRAGRCGEWANCFALLCRALGFDTRHVVDWTDHVWVEVWSDAQARWLHADPCEDVCDKPLVYEVGWGKRLTYVVAASKDEVQDVGWRYSADHAATRARRTLVRPAWLNRTLLKLTEKCQSGYTAEEKKRLALRRLQELVELMKPRDQTSASEDETLGRLSGSTAWRLARGELGVTGGSKKTVWILSEEEKEALVFHLEYDVVKDEYVRVSKSDERTAGWQNGVSESSGVVRKVEEDWEQIYLARTEESAKSTLKWEVDLSGTEFSVRTIELDVSSKTYQTGRVMWQLCGGTMCLLPVSGITLKSDELAGSKKISLTAMMSGGQGNVSWQHSQLFRSHKDSQDGPQMRIIIKLKKD